MRILVVTVVHQPFDARIHHRQILAMRREGFEVTQVAPWSATGAASAQGVEGVTAIDVPRAVGRHRLAALIAARRAIRDLGPRHDLVLIHDPELMLAVWGLLRRLPPVVLDVHEDLAASLQDRTWLPRGLSRLTVRGVRRWERWAEDHLASLLLAEDGYRARFRRDHPVVPNLPWLPPRHDHTVHADRVVYIGRLSTGRGAQELLQIADRLRELDGPRLELVGPADADVEPRLHQAQQRGSLRWHGFLPNDEALAIVRGSLAGLAPLHDLPNYRISLPTKVAEYLAHGVPAIVTPLPEAQRLVRESGAGAVVPFGDVNETVAAILELAADPARRARLGEAARTYAEAGANWDAEVPGFVAHLRSVAGTHRGSPGSATAPRPTSEQRGRP